MDNNTIKTFVETYYPLAQRMEQKYGIPAYALLSQMALESNFGTSNFARGRNNFGGIGAHDRNPDAAMTFNSPEEAIDYQARVQMAKPNFPESPAGRQAIARYGSTAPILSDRNNSPESVFAAMQDSGWASDKEYATKLMSRYNQIAPFIEKNTAMPPGTPPTGVTRANPVDYPPKPTPTPKPQKKGFQDYVLDFLAPRVGPPRPTPAPGIKYTSPTGETSYIDRQGKDVQPTPTPGFVTQLLDRLRGR